VPGCTAASIGAPAVSVTVVDQHNAPIADVPVYVFDHETYTNISATTDANGVVSFTLPEGDYRFRADVDGTQIYSAAANHCALPGCTVVTISAYRVTLTVQDQARPRKCSS
jgi:hypothetical protein